MTRVEAEKNLLSIFETVILAVDEGDHPTSETAIILAMSLLVNSAGNGYRIAEMPDETFEEFSNSLAGSFEKSLTAYRNQLKETSHEPH